MACTFSLLAGALAVNVTDKVWAAIGPMLEFVLRYIIWFYAFGLCALSINENGRPLISAGYSIGPLLFKKNNYFIYIYPAAGYPLTKRDDFLI